MNKKISIILSLVTILPIILSIILGSWLPIIIVAVAGLLFFIFGILLWDFTYRKIISPLTKLVKDKNKRPAVIIISVSILILVVTMVIVLIIASSGSNDKKVDETTTLHTSEETTEEETVTTTEEETTEEETETTTEEITTEEETTTSKINPSGYKEGKEEGTLQNQEEIASSRREELYIPSGAQDQADSIVTTIGSGSNTEVGSEQDTTHHIAVGPVEKPTTKPAEPNSSGFIEVEKPSDFYDETTTSKKTEEETVTTEEETTKEITTGATGATEETTKVTPKTDISVSYTSGARVANVLVTFDSAVDAKFKISFDNLETSNYTVNKNSNTSYSIKVTVPSNYLGRLIVIVLDSKGNELKQKIKIINSLLVWH